MTSTDRLPSERAVCHPVCGTSPSVPPGLPSACGAELPVPPVADWFVPPVEASFSSPQSNVSSTHLVLKRKQVVWWCFWFFFFLVSLLGEGKVA